MDLTNTLRDALLVLLQIALFAGLVLLQKWKTQAVEYYAKRNTTSQREWLKLVGNEAFHYAEQVFTAHDGPAKLNEAVKYVLDRAQTHGIPVTYPEVRAVIEKAWAEFQVHQKSQGQVA
ncbi:hypothetical protein JJB07_05815 [Tumebacillus sp. ITR2]|uniref:Phage holin n=1 Tax=Tumebacillus amylolyticus TaxID=2801339 RepID=A0ABS1J7H5_9BACL|nr:phage holin, LLH family [Tumebacillus amylolyticus]MBL0386167.1 hypothetical protein [Tumebacillus amylolyticus]